MAAPGATAAAAAEGDGGGGDSPAEGEEKEQEKEKADGEQEAGQAEAEAEPLTYYIDPSVPTEWREYMKSGVEAWRPAFQEAGLGEEAIRGEVLAQACLVPWACFPMIRLLRRLCAPRRMRQTRGSRVAPVVEPVRAL